MVACSTTAVPAAPFQVERSLYSDLQPEARHAARVTRCACCAAVQVDMAVVEVGMGGARDATNVLGDTLRVAVFCAVAEDHKGAIGERTGLVEPVWHLEVSVTVREGCSCVPAWATWPLLPGHQQ